jgi:hypothetical protein
MSSRTPRTENAYDAAVPFLSSAALGLRQVAALPGWLRGKLHREATSPFPADSLLSPFSDAVLVVIGVAAILASREVPSDRIAALLATLMAATVPSRPTSLVALRLIAWVATFLVVSAVLVPVLGSSYEYSSSGSTTALATVIASGGGGFVAAIATRRRRIRTEVTFLACAWAVATGGCGLFVTRAAAIQSVEMQRSALEVRLAPARRAHKIHFEPGAAATEMRELVAEGELREARRYLAEVQSSFPAFPGLAELNASLAAADARERAAEQDLRQQEHLAEAAAEQQRLLSEQLAQRAEVSKLACLQGCLAIREQCLDSLQLENDCVQLQRRCIDRRCGGL